MRASYGRRIVPLASLPNPAEPGFVAIGAAIGAFAGGTAGRVLRYDADNWMRWAAEGSYYGTGLSLGVYLVVNVMRLGL